MRIQDFIRFRDITLIQPQRVKVIVPPFNLAVPTWSGASQRLIQFPFSNSYFFVLRRGIKKFGSNFIAAVSFIEDNIVTRYKLWDDSLGVLYYPIYDGDVLGPNANLEIWSINSPNAPSLGASVTLDTSALAFQTIMCTSCCSNPNVAQLLVQQDPTLILPGDQCNPFCDTLSV